MSGENASSLNPSFLVEEAFRNKVLNDTNKNFMTTILLALWEVRTFHNMVLVNVSRFSATVQAAFDNINIDQINIDSGKLDREIFYRH